MDRTPEDKYISIGEFIILRWKERSKLQYKKMYLSMYATIFMTVAGFMFFWSSNENIGQNNILTLCLVIWIFAVMIMLFLTCLMFSFKMQEEGYQIPPDEEEMEGGENNTEEG